jgi:hypothetical protein
MTAELDHIGITVAGLWDVPSWDSVPARLADAVAALRDAVERPDPEVISAFTGVPVDAVTRTSVTTSSGVALELLAFTPGDDPPGLPGARPSSGRGRSHP